MKIPPNTHIHRGSPLRYVYSFSLLPQLGPRFPPPLPQSSTSTPCADLSGGLRYSSVDRSSEQTETVGGLCRSFPLQCKLWLRSENQKKKITFYFTSCHRSGHETLLPKLYTSEPWDGTALPSPVAYFIREKTRNLQV